MPARFEKLSRLGEGTYSIVYKCRDRSNDSCVVAVKVIRPQLSSVEDQLHCQKRRVLRHRRASSVPSGSSKEVPDSFETLTKDVLQYDEGLAYSDSDQTSLSSSYLSDDCESAASPDDYDSTFVDLVYDRLHVSKRGKFDRPLPSIRPKTPSFSPCLIPSTTLRECAILRSLPPHPNIVTLFEIISSDVESPWTRVLTPAKPQHKEETNSRRRTQSVRAESRSRPSLSSPICMVFEYLPFDLRRALNTHPNHFSLSVCKSLFHQLLFATRHLHLHGIYHRDIKPHNILLNADLTVSKLTDFNLSRLETGSRWEDRLREPFTNTVVTLWYRCPEVILGSTVYEGGVDMWSLGCVLYDLTHPKSRPIFAAHTEIEMLFRIFHLFGTPQCGGTGLTCRATRKSGSLDVKKSQISSDAENEFNFNQKGTSKRNVRNHLPNQPIDSEFLNLCQLSGFCSHFPKWPAPIIDEEWWSKVAPNLDSGGRDLFLHLLQPEPQNRISVAAACSHPWFFCS